MLRSVDVGGEMVSTLAERRREVVERRCQPVGWEEGVEEA